MGNLPPPVSKWAGHPGALQTHHFTSRCCRHDPEPGGQGMPDLGVGNPEGVLLSVPDRQGGGRGCGGHSSPIPHRAQRSTGLAAPWPCSWLHGCSWQHGNRLTREGVACIKPQ